MTRIPAKDLIDVAEAAKKVLAANPEARLYVDVRGASMELKDAMSTYGIRRWNPDSVEDLCPRCGHTVKDHDHGSFGGGLDDCHRPISLDTWCGCTYYTERQRS